MGKPSRDKGARVERELVHKHIALGIHSERVPLSGAPRYQNNGGDIDLYVFGKDEAPLIGESKARKNGGGFKVLEDWLGENDVLFLKRNNADPMIVLPWRTWERLLAK